MRNLVLDYYSMDTCIYLDAAISFFNKSVASSTSSGSSAVYIVQAKQGTNVHTTKIHLVHDGTTVYLTQYASIFDNGAQATFDADINSGSVRLRVTPASTDNMTIKVIRQAIEV